MDAHTIRMIIENSCYKEYGLVYFMVYLSGRNCGVPLHSLEYSRGECGEIYWRDKYIVNGLEFPYSTNDFKHLCVGLKRRRIMHIFLLPRAEHIGESEAVILLLDKKNSRICRLNIVYIGDNTFQICARGKNNKYYFDFGRISSIEEIGYIVQNFDLIMDCYNVNCVQTV